MSSPDVRVDKDDKKRENVSNPSPDVVDTNTAEYLSWRRLHLAKSKLNNVTEMASFMAGFAVVATVELQINDDDVQPPLLTAFVVTTALLVATCMIAITISTCVLPHIESVAKTNKISSANLSPHDKMRRLIDISWILTNSASLFFFTLDVILMCWIKYTYFTVAASVAATVIMAPVLVIILVFAALFYRRIVKHQYVISSMKYEELERMHKELERVPSLTSISYQGTITSNYQASVGPSNTNLRKQWMIYQQQHRTNNGHSSPHHQPSPRSPPAQMQRSRDPRYQHHYFTNHYHPYYSNNNRQYQRQFSHPDHLPFNPSQHPHAFNFDPRMGPPDTPSTTPVSPAPSNKSFSPSVLTV